MHKLRGKKASVGRPWTAAEDALLGKMSDRKVGLRLERATLAVFARRRALGIPAWLRAAARNRRAWTAAEDALLGTMSDAAAAVQLERRRPEIIARRRSLGVPTWRRGGHAAKRP
jgi:hypothetical protein